MGAAETGPDTAVDAGEGNRWLKRLRPAADREVRLFCFPYAGGAASLFRDWAAQLPRSVEPVAVQLPGREDRFDEPAFDRMPPLVDALVEALGPLLREPYALLGVSMGARVALALARAAGRTGLPTARGLFVACSAAPALRRRVRGWDESDRGLVDYLRDLGGTPDAVLHDPELLELLLPTLRADLTVVATDEPVAGPPLRLPIHAFAGATDDEASPVRMAPWRRETEGPFRLDVLPGGHFLSADSRRRMMELVGRELTGAS